MKSYKNYLFFLVFIGISFNTKSQIIIEGFTKDEKSNSLAYVSFYCKNKFIGMSNELGKFQFQIPDSLKFDILKCKYLGYTPSVISLNEWSKSKEQTIILKQSSIALNDFEVKTKTNYKFGKPKFVGSLKNNSNMPYFIHLGPGSVVGLFIKNEFSKLAYLKKAHFYITKDGFPGTKFRVHVYEVNNDGMPEKELLDSNYYGQGSDTGEKWVTVDLSKAAIQFPTSGLIIAMEWLPIAEGQIAEKNSSKTKTKSKFKGQYLGSTFLDEDYTVIFASKWFKPHVISSNSSKYVNPTIKAEFDMVK